jgi:2-polyprenyl-6-methoxyphenol hydroxylase-like FAD-dependent oxidoreductase
MIEHAVIIAGAGPTGLMLAGELKLARIDVAIVERRANQELAGTRARGLHARTIEVLDQRGLAERFISEGKLAQIARFAQDDTGVDVEAAEGQTYRGQYLVACDGGRSRLRKEAGIAFRGTDPTVSNLIAEVELAGEPSWGIRRDAIGIHGLSRLDDRGRAEVLVTEQHVGRAEDPTLRDLSEALTAVYGTDYGVHSPTFISRFTDMTRQAAAYRDGRLLIAGDAAHVHPSDGGHGLQVGIQDAVNLGWKLAQVVHGMSPHTLLDTYHEERHPVAARLLRSTLASVALRQSDERTEALRGTLAELLGMDEPRKRLGAMISGLDIRYGLGLPDAAERHPLLGRRMPDLDLATLSGPSRVFTSSADGVRRASA